MCISFAAQSLDARAAEVNSIKAALTQTERRCNAALDLLGESEERVREVCRRITFFLFAR